MAVKEARKPIKARKKTGKPYLQMTRHERNYAVARYVLGFPEKDLPAVSTLGYTDQERQQYKALGYRLDIPDYTGSRDEAWPVLQAIAPHLTLQQRDELIEALGGHNGEFSLEDMLQVNGDVIGQALLYVHGVEV